MDRGQQSSTAKGNHQMALGVCCAREPRMRGLLLQSGAVHEKPQVLAVDNQIFSGTPLYCDTIQVPERRF